MNDFHHLKPHIRWMIRRDMPEVLAIENDRFPCPWSEDDFLRCLRQRNCIGMVATNDEIKEKCILGFMIYELHKSQLEILNIAVRRDVSRRGVGSLLIKKLRDKLSNQRRNRISFDVADWNLPGHLFLKSQGFVCDEILQAFWHEPDGDVDAYRFSFCHGEPAMVSPK
jgi:ribosomal-protein-alanine N-acetyltransferase